MGELEEAQQRFLDAQAAKLSEPTLEALCELARLADLLVAEKITGLRFTVKAGLVLADLERELRELP